MKNDWVVSVVQSQVETISKIPGFVEVGYKHRAKIVATKERVDAFKAWFTTEDSSAELEAKLAQALGENFFPRFNRVWGAMTGGGLPLYIPEVE